MGGTQKRVALALSSAAKLTSLCKWRFTSERSSFLEATVWAGRALLLQHRLRWAWRLWDELSEAARTDLHVYRSQRILQRGFERVLLRAAEVMARHDRCGRTLASLLHRPSLSLRSVERALLMRRVPSIAKQHVCRTCLHRWMAKIV